MEPGADKEPAEKPGETPRPGQGPAKQGDEKKIFVKSDESWKAEAQREKERLQKKAAAEEAQRNLPPPSIMTFIGDLGMQAMLALGLMELKGAGGPKRDLPAARYTIDLLGVLKDKTRGNLTPDEQAHLDQLLTNLRIAFAKTAKEEEKEGAKVVGPEKKIIT
jgi:uncharacterized protein DUF1844